MRIFGPETACNAQQTSNPSPFGGLAMLCNRAQSAYQQRPAGLMNLREKVVDISSLNRVKIQNMDLHVEEYARGAGKTLMTTASTAHDCGPHAWWSNLCHTNGSTVTAALAHCQMHSCWRHHRAFTSDQNA